MSRMQALVHRPKRTLAALATVLVAVGVTAASGANFTASSANPSNTFATGTLTMSNSKGNAAILTASGMRPGDSAQGTVDIANTGSLSGTFALTKSNLVNSDATNPLTAKLDLVVTDCGAYTGAGPATCGDANDTTAYSGTISALTNVSLGTFTGGQGHTYKFVATLNTSADNNYQGDTGSVEFDWNAS